MESSRRIEDASAARPATADAGAAASADATGLLCTKFFLLAVKELYLSYYFGEPLVITVYIYRNTPYGNLN